MKAWHSFLMLGLALFLDLILADPYSWPHPVKAIGAYISWYEQSFNVFNQPEEKKEGLGLGLVISLLAISLALSLGLLWLSYKVHKGLFALVYIYLSYTCISIRGMAKEASMVVRSLENQGLEGGRAQVSRIVGRQTDQLSQEEIYAATIETTSENTADGAIAPLFYLLLFGPVGGILYKAINTMDSMVAYNTPKYQAFGRYPALLDDLANYLPARLSALFMVLAGAILGLRAKQGVKIVRRDARNHLSPNAGYPEAAIAGLLGIQLGGSHTYDGKVIFKPTIGEASRTIQARDVGSTIRILYLSSVLFFFIFGLLVYPIKVWILG